MVQVQAILFASLTASLFSAFLAMLGKQWLNRYDSSDMRGSAIERSQNRQRKMDGIVAWYFDHVMESLPLMLQAALLLLGCALSRYLWGTNIIIASVVIGVTSFGIIFYLFIVIAGTVSEDCPYQTPAAHIFRHIFCHYLLPAIRSAPSFISSKFSRFLQVPERCRASVMWATLDQDRFSMHDIAASLLYIPAALASGAYSLGRTVLQSPVAFRRIVVRWFTGTSSFPRSHDLDQQTITWDLRCVSWILQTSLDKAIRLSTFKHLAAIPELTHFDPTLVMDCFNIFMNCVSVTNHRVVTMRGLEQLATVSARCLFRTFCHLSVTDPTSNALTDLRRRYKKVFPPELDLDFTGLPFRCTMNMIHALADQRRNPRRILWGNDGPSAQEHILFSQYMAKTARVEYQRTRCTKVPRWTLRFVLYSLSLDPPPPPSAIANYLEIIAIELDCNLSSDTPLTEMYLRLNFMRSPRF